jgi:hypothetical protein
MTAYTPSASAGVATGRRHTGNPFLALMRAAGGLCASFLTAVAAAHAYERLSCLSGEELRKRGYGEDDAVRAVYDLYYKDV